MLQCSRQPFEFLSDFVGLHYCANVLENEDSHCYAARLESLENYDFE
jgi:hypothetical protein